MFLPLLISLSMAASGGPWLVKAPQANPHEFFVFTQNTAESKVSQALTACEQSGKVTQLLKEAQFNFLNGSLGSAKEGFEKINDMKWSCDWKEDERKIITFAMFRLAQLSDNPAEQMNFLSDAIGFDDDIKPDASVFPPPLISLYNKTKQQLIRQPLILPDFTKKYSSLLRNGKFISLSNMAISSYPLRARLTLVSEAYLPETIVVTPEEFQAYQLEPRAMIDGGCDNFTVAKELESLPIKVYFSRDCVKIKEAQEAVAPLATFSPGLATETAMTPRKKTWLERNLLWVGVAVVSSVAIAYMANQHGGDGQQTVVKPNNTLSEENQKP
jgi:hypothetical protein